VIWHRHSLSHHRPGAILLGFSLAFVLVASTANAEIAHHHPKFKPTTTSTVTILAFLKSWWQQFMIVLILKIDLLESTQPVKLESLWSCGLKEYLHTLKNLVCDEAMPLSDA
jgi:hypothetical protein